MAVFIDTNVLAYAKAETRAPIRDACARVVTATGAGLIDARTSVAVLEELWHLELRGRPAGLDDAAADAYAVFTPLLPVTDETLRAALQLDAGSLGSNDRIHAATCGVHGIETIVSADGAFDDVPTLRRLDPGDTRAMAELLG